MSAGRSSLTTRVRVTFPVTASGRIEVSRVTPLAPMGVGRDHGQRRDDEREQARDEYAEQHEGFPREEGATDPLWADPY